MFGDIQFLDFTNVLGGAASLDSSLKAYKTSETRGFFPYKRFNQPYKKLITELPLHGAFCSKMQGCIVFEADCMDYVNLVILGSKLEQVVAKLKLSKSPDTGVED